MATLLTREASNPILTAAMWPYPVHSVFNPAAVEVNGETLLLVRCEDQRGVSHFATARSRDGVHDWRIAAEPALACSSRNWPEEVWGVEDPRLSYLDELKKWALVYTAFSQGGPLVALALTADFEHYERIGAVMPPEDKDAVLFPRRMDGRWAMLHRPIPHSGAGRAHVWISFSPDLRHWGDHQVLLRAREGSWWDASRIGVCTPPLETDEGWLIIYHGVRTTGSGVLYRLGLALLDIDDPTRVLKRTDQWIFGPEAPYERHGDVGGVVFPCGWVRRDDEVRIYYGAADSTVCLAYARLSELLRVLHEQTDTYGRALHDLGKDRDGRAGPPPHRPPPHHSPPHHSPPHHEE